jgi:hypothetical protein
MAPWIVVFRNGPLAYPSQIGSCYTDLSAHYSVVVFTTGTALTDLVVVSTLSLASTYGSFNIPAVKATFWVGGTVVIFPTLQKFLALGTRHVQTSRIGVISEFIRVHG